jgi:hypothetical protein
MAQILLEFLIMIVAALLFAAGTGLALIVHELRRAPEGYEDETGFHVINSPATKAVPEKLIRQSARQGRRTQPATAH